MCSQNAANAISGIQILKIFWGDMPTDPPTNLVPLALAPPKFRKVFATDYKMDKVVPYLPRTVCKNRIIHFLMETR